MGLESRQESMHITESALSDEAWRKLRVVQMIFKQLLQLDAIDVCQIDSCRLAGVNEILSVLLMSKKFGVPVCPHAGGVGLCEYVVSTLRVIEYLSSSDSRSICL